MSNDLYVKTLETKNDELSERLAAAETQLKKIGRRRGTYPVFKILKKMIRKNVWAMEYEYLTNCDCVKIIRPTVNFTIMHPLSIEDEKELIGFQYWRQSINYKWALAGTSKYLDLDLKLVYDIAVDPKNGQVFYKDGY